VLLWRANSLQRGCAEDGVVFTGPGDGERGLLRSGAGRPEGDRHRTTGAGGDGGVAGVGVDAKFARLCASDRSMEGDREFAGVGDGDGLRRAGLADGDLDPGETGRREREGSRTEQQGYTELR